MFSLICASINDWVNDRKAGDLRRYLTHYDVTVMNTRHQQGHLANRNYDGAFQGGVGDNIILKSVLFQLNVVQSTKKRYNSVNKLLIPIRISCCLVIVFTGWYCILFLMFEDCHITSPFIVAHDIWYIVNKLWQCHHLSTFQVSRRCLQVYLLHYSCRRLSLCTGGHYLSSLSIYQ